MIGLGASRTAVAAVALAAIAIGCINTTGDDAAQAALTAPSTSVATSSGSAETARSRVGRLREKVAWVGELHRVAMDDLVANKAAYLGEAGSKTARQCRAVAALVRKHSPTIESRLGQSFTSEERAAKVREVLRLTPKCRDAVPSAMSVYSALPALTLSRMAAIQEDTVTGAFAPYLDQINNAVGSTDGSPNAVGQAVDQIVYTAANAGLSDPDLEVVVGAAAVAASSSSGWQATQQSGGFPSCSPFETCYVYLESAYRALPILGLLVGADVIGGATCAVVAHQTGTKNAQQLIGAFGWGALGTSAATALAFM